MSFNSKKCYKGYTEIDVDLWTEGVVEYAFMSDGSDELKDFAFDVDAKIGFNKVFIQVYVFMISTHFSDGVREYNEGNEED